MGGAHISATSLSLIIVWIILCRSSNLQHCGHPGKPAFSKFDSNDFYEAGDKVIYECMNGYLLNSPFRSLNEFILFGQRECLSNGTWSYGNVHCYRMFSVKNFSCGWDQNGYCSLVEAVDSASEVLHVTFSKGEYIHKHSAFNVWDCEQWFEMIWSNASSAMYRFPVDKFSNKCLQSLNPWIRISVGEKVEISVQPYGRNGLCGTPETPANGRLIRLNTTTAQYVCNSGYQLVGNEYRYCIDSFWNGTQVICNKTTDGYHSWQSNGHDAWILDAGYGFFSISVVAIAISILTLLILIGVLCVKRVNRNNRINQPISERAPSVIYMNTRIGATGSTESETYAEIQVNNAVPANDNIYEQPNQSSTSQLVEVLYAQPTRKNQRK